MPKTNATRSAGSAPLQFGKYWLDAELAVGGMARLLRARLRGPGGFEKKLVVKQILPELAQDPSFVELLVREANTLVQMSHPNIVTVYELGVVDGVYFLAMELVEGATVAELLRDGPLDEGLCAHIGAQVCEALRYAHERFDLVHRDVTPRNIIVDAGGHVRLLDFGIAAPLSLTGQGERFGSPGYMSPEQARGEALSARSDLFSLGVVLHEALTGERPVPAEDARASSLGEFAELPALISAMIADDPARRPSSAGEVAGALRTWLARTHPQGVAAALGERAERARQRAAETSLRAPSAITSEPGSAPGMAGVTRSIARSDQLTQLLDGATERLPSAAARPHKIRRRRHALAAALLLAAAIVALGVARSAWNPPRSRSVAPPSAPHRVGPLAPASTSQAAPREEQGAGSSVPAASVPVAPAAAASTPAATAGAKRAYLSINALPWAELRLDDRPLGTTPKRGVPVPPGAHVLWLSCPALGRQARVPLQLTGGTRYRVVVDLQVSPPSIAIQ
jgi:eukaryotic-like serine/threonine-protein kinase